MTNAVFFDRDGVLIRDVDLLTDRRDIYVLEKIAETLQKLKGAGFKLLVVTNQTVVARGLASAAEVDALNQEMERQIQQKGGPHFDGIYVCPHHPNATLVEYRKVCECRKPQPGLFFQAAREHEIDLPHSFMVGDRITDIIAGAKAGCRTVLVQTGKHSAAPIETSDPLDLSVQPDYICADLSEAAKWILNQ